jgi:FkbM family methyltransferase
MFARLREQKRPVRFLLSRILWHSGLSRGFVIERERYRLRFSRSAVAAQYWLGDDPLREDEAFYARYLRPGDTVVDVGANIGLLTVLASSLVGESGRVFAFEPHPATFQSLQDNVELNQATNVEAGNFAVGAHAGRVHLSDGRSDDQNSVVTSGGREVAMDTLDALLAGKAPRIDLLKVDVEGYEKFVFEGAAHSLARTQCVYFEAGNPRAGEFGYSESEVLKQLSSAGLSLFRWDEAGLTRVAADYVPPRCENLIALRDVDDFRHRTGVRPAALQPISGVA